MTDDKPDTKATQETRDRLNAISPDFILPPQKLAEEKSEGESGVAEPQASETETVAPDGSTATEADSTTTS